MPTDPKVQTDIVLKLLEDTVNGALKKCTRVEVISDQGRDYVNWNLDNKITISFQDDYKTLKIFIQ